LGHNFAPVEAAHRPCSGMSRPTDQELSPSAARRMLRSIAHLDWVSLDQATGTVLRQSIFLGPPAPAPPATDVFEDIDEGDEDEGRIPAAQALLWRKSGGGSWYLNEVPEDLIDACERELCSADRLIHLPEPPEVGAA
jgi:hypothetical protein